jgi:hypothetical protein
MLRSMVTISTASVRRSGSARTALDARLFLCRHAYCATSKQLTNRTIFRTPIVLADKRGHIEARQPRILDRLRIDGERFLGYADRMLKSFGHAIGAPATMTSVEDRVRSCILRRDC